MRNKEMIRKFQRFIARIGIQFCSLLVKVIPQSWIYAFAHFIARIIFFLDKRHRNIAIEGLSLAFGKEKTKKEINKIAFACFEEIAKMGIEFLFLLENQPLIHKYVEVEGMEHLKRALKKGKGVIALSAHFGNFPLLLTKLALDGQKVAVMLRYMRDLWVNQYFQEKRESLGIGSIYTEPRRVCIAKSLEALSKNHVLFIQMDQNFGTGGIFVDFFGHQAATAKGPIVFALRTGAPIVPMFIYRKGSSCKHKLVIESEMELETGKDAEESVQLNAAKFTKIIEHYVRKYPAAWGWIHRRWKTRPVNVNSQ